MDEVIAIMGQPQRGDRQSAYDVSREGPVFYLEPRSAHSGRMVGHTQVIAKNGALSHRQLPPGCGHAL